MKSCNIYFDTQCVYVIGNAETTHGFNIASESMVKLPRTAPPALLGTTVYHALSLYKKGVPVPKDLAKLDKILLTFVGYKSWRSFERQAKCVLVELESQKVKVTPTVVGSEGGFLYRPECALMADCGSESIGDAILQALGRSEE
jgi:hypothetical protein